MIRDITIGQYYSSNSIIHKLDPRIKILAILSFIFSLFAVSSLLIYPFVAVFILIILKISKIPFKFIFKGLKGIFMIVIFTVVLNLFFTNGEEILFEFYFLKASKEGLILAISMVTRIVFLITMSSMLTLTTSPMELTNGIESLLGPFKKIGLPASVIALMMSIALTYIPKLLEDTDRIMKAQEARGVDFKTGGIIKRVKNLLPVIVPLFVSAFRRADDLALAMEARCYSDEFERTKLNELIFEKKDLIAVITVLIYLIVLFTLNYFLIIKRVV